MKIERNLKGNELKEFLIAELNNLADNIVQDPDQLLEFCKKWKDGFYTYSLNNTLLVLAQRPDSSLLAGMRAWNKRGRRVIKGQKALRIFAPMIKKVETEDGDEQYIIGGFKIVNVFDIGQTHGEPVDVGCSDYIQGDVDFDSLVKKCPFPVYIENKGLSNGATDGIRIWITPKKNKAAMAATLLHEWSHCVLNHCTQSRILFETEERSAQEIEAESCSYIVCSILGIKNDKSKYYVGNWKGTAEDLQGRGKKILAAAEQIIRILSPKGADSNV